MHTASYEFLMKPKESAGCHQTLSARVGSGDETTVTHVSGQGIVCGREVFIIHYDDVTACNLSTSCSCSAVCVSRFRGPVTKDQIIVH